jgi:HSP20 family protein
MESVMASLLPSLWSKSGDLRDPFRAMTREIDDMMRDYGRRFPSLEIGAAMPVVNIAETKDAIEVTAELPGVDAKDIKVSVEGNRLVLSGEKKTESEQKEKEWHVVERSYGAFHRSIVLPFEPKDEAVSANFDKGILHLAVKKPVEIAGKGAKAIEIKTGAPPQAAQVGQAAQPSKSA